MDPNRINNNPAIAEKLFTEIFVNNNRKHAEQNQSKRRGIVMIDMLSGGGHSAAVAAATARPTHANVSRTHFESSNINYMTPSTSGSNSFVQQEIRNIDNDVNILIYTNRGIEHTERHNKLTFHDVLISELTEHNQRSNDVVKRYNATTKILPNTNNHMRSNSTKNSTLVPHSTCMINVNADRSASTTATTMVTTSYARTTINVNNNSDYAVIDSVKTVQGYPNR